VSNPTAGNANQNGGNGHGRISNGNTPATPKRNVKFRSDKVKVRKLSQREFFCCQAFPDSKGAEFAEN
jgi:hypothetical protein